MTKKEKKKEETEEKEGLGIAEAVLNGLGNILPGISSIIKEAIKADVVKERLHDVNKEIEAKLRGRYLKKGDIVVERSFSVRPLISARPGKGKPIRFSKPVRHVRGIEEIKKLEPEKIEREPLIDVFDEKDILRVIVELPGVEEKDIHIETKDNLLVISAEQEDRKYQKEIKLPCAIGKMEKNYKNGILEIRLEKKLKKPEKIIK
ncbi:MAG: Hsp20/alpha crystallin family protein [Nanoarchaeota archaeon]|nr:Hsp20/alpha crystallin family protein [Nanoarchaeota archaeon]